MAGVLLATLVASPPVAGQTAHNATVPGGLLSGLSKLDRKLTEVIHLAEKGKANGIDVVHAEIELDGLERDFFDQKIYGHPFYTLQRDFQLIDIWLQHAVDEVGIASIGESVHWLDDALAAAQDLKTKLNGKGPSELDTKLQRLEDDLARVTEKTRNGELKRGPLKDAIGEVARRKYEIRAVEFPQDVFGMSFAPLSNDLDQIHTGLTAAEDALLAGEDKRAVDALEAAKKVKQKLEATLHKFNETTTTTKPSACSGTGKTASQTVTEPSDIAQPNDYDFATTIPASCNILDIDHNAQKSVYVIDDQTNTIISCSQPSSLPSPPGRSCPNGAYEGPFPGDPSTTVFVKPPAVPQGANVWHYTVELRKADIPGTQASIHVEYTWQGPQ